MKKLFFIFSLFTSIYLFSSSPSLYATTSASVPSFLKEDIATFTPPAGWRMAPDVSSKFTHVKAMVVGKGDPSYPPNLNLSLETYTGTLKDYLTQAKNFEIQQGNEWKDLGSIRTEAGSGSLSQVDTKGGNGTIRFMRVILLKNRTIYILTASALAKDFSLYYKDFFASMRSLRIIKDPYEMIQSVKAKEELKLSTDKVLAEWNAFLTQHSSDATENQKTALFENESFQNKTWKPFTEMITKKYGYLGKDWEALLVNNVKEEIL